MKIDKRFQLLLTEDELEQVREEAIRRGISAGEFIRLSIRNELSQHTSQDRRGAIQSLSDWDKE